MLAYNAGAYQSVTPLGCSTLGQALGPTHKHQTRLERLARDERSSLLRIFVNDGRKKFYNIGPWPDHRSGDSGQDRNRPVFSGGS